MDNESAAEPGLGVRHEERRARSSREKAPPAGSPPQEAYEGLIAEAALVYRLDANLIRAVMRAESAFNPLVVSPAGAQGLMQIMPALAQEPRTRATSG